MKRVVVFGGTGFIGSRLCLYLSTQGFSVLCLGKKNPFETAHENIQFHQIDFLDIKTWKNMISEGDYVCNLVAPKITKDFSEKHEADYFFAVESLANECITKKVKNFLYVSSGGSVYGNGNKPFSETDETLPISAYGILKLKTEKALLSYQERFKLPLCIVRPSNIYGETQGFAPSTGVITNFCEHIAKDRPLNILGDLDICKDYLHVDDLVRGLCLILIEQKTGIFNLGFGKTYTLREIIQKVEFYSNKKAICVFHPLKETDIPHYALNCNKARIELNFEPRISLDEGIKRYFKEGSK